jgi:hypothetical protein
MKNNLLIEKKTRKKPSYTSNAVEWILTAILLKYS